MSEKEIVAILKKEKEADAGMVYYLIGIVFWVAGIVVNTIRYMYPAQTPTMYGGIGVSDILLIISGIIFFIIGIAFMGSGNRRNTYSNALRKKNYTIKQVSVENIEDYDGIVYVKCIDEAGEKYEGKLCKACINSLKESGSRQGYYIEVSSNTDFRKYIPL